MASSKEYLSFVLDHLSALDGITYRAMMGEFIIYFRGKIAGGICDDRFLVKPTPSAVRLLPDAQHVAPYPGAGEMLLADNIDDRDRLCELINAIADDMQGAGRKR